MKTIYVTGHRNPDIDSICAAYAYAKLKGILDRDNEYKAVRCGHLSESSRKQLELTGMEIPEYVRDIYPKVNDVMLTGDEKMDADEPIYSLVQSYYNTNKPSAIPLYENGKFVGLLSIDDITTWFLKDNYDTIPTYTFKKSSFEKVLPGSIVYNEGSDNFEAPIYAGAAAFDDFCKFLDEHDNGVLVLGLRPENIKYAIKKNVPAIVITTINEDPDIDFTGYKGFVYRTSLSTAEALRRLRMIQPLKTMMGEQAEPLQVTDFFEDAKEQFLSSSIRGFAVFNGDDYAGFVTRRCFLKKPSHSVILVDHNEKEQSIRGIETANIIEIIDHHRLNALKTDNPIYIAAEPVGSTCTIVFEQYMKNHIMPDKITAKVLLTGIIADTLILKSPTTTGADVSRVSELASLAGINDVKAYGEELFSMTETLSEIDPETAIKSDFKTYDVGGIKVGIGQCEATTLNDLNNYYTKYADALCEINKNSGLDWSMLMITDIIRERSVLIITDHKAARKLPYMKIDNQLYDMPGVMSRKKQLLPTVLHVLE